MSKFRVATLEEYLDWFQIWRWSGNKPTHYYDYPFERWETWLFAKEDFRTDGECGAWAAHIIVPKGIQHLGGAIGHNQLYFANGTAGNRFPIVPVFNNPEFKRIRSVRKFIQAEEKKAAQFWADMKSREELRAYRDAGTDIGAFLRPHAD